MGVDRDNQDRLIDLLEQAWGVIANAGGGDWKKESPEWQRAAAKFRNSYHKTVKEITE